MSDVFSGYKEKVIMDNSTGKNPKVITGKRYLILGRPAGQLLFCLAAIVYYLYCVPVPIFYVLETHFPEKQDIHYTEGLFIYREVGRKNYQVGLRTNNGNEFFSCKPYYPAPDLCEVDRQHYKKLEDELKRNDKNTNIVIEPKLYQQWKNKPARIGWFTQRYNLFSSDRRVVQLIIDGNEIVSNENVNKRIKRNHNDWYFSVIVSSPMLIIILYLIRNLILNNEIKDEK